MKKSKDPSALISTEYRQFIDELKVRVNSASISAARAVNRELILLYWDIGQAIVKLHALYNLFARSLQICAQHLSKTNEKRHLVSAVFALYAARFSEAPQSRTI